MLLYWTRYVLIVDPGLYSAIPRSLATSMPKALFVAVPKLTSSKFGTGKKQISTGLPVLQESTGHNDI